MPDSLYALALLACPLGMGAMMWMMMRGQDKPSAGEDNSTKQAEFTALQAQIDQLQAQQRDTQGVPPGPADRR